MNTRRIFDLSVHDWDFDRLCKTVSCTDSGDTIDLIDGFSSTILSGQRHPNSGLSQLSSSFAGNVYLRLGRSSETPERDSRPWKWPHKTRTKVLSLGLSLSLLFLIVIQDNWWFVRTWHYCFSLDTFFDRLMRLCTWWFGIYPRCRHLDAASFQFQGSRNMSCPWLE